VPSFRTIAMSAVAAAVIAAGVAITPAAATDAESPAEALPLHWVVKQLARKGGAMLMEIEYQGGAYRASVLHEDGRLSLLTIDAEDGSIRPTDQGDLLRNSFDLGVLDGIRGAFASNLPDGARPAVEIVNTLMQTGKYADVRSLRVADGIYRVVMVDKSGAPVTLRIDPVTGSLAGQGA